MLKLGRPHFIYLREVTLGVASVTRVEHYFAPENRYAAEKLHRALIERARAMARNAKLPGWRLIGIPFEGNNAGTDPDQPTLEQWAAQKRYDWMSVADLQPLYDAAFPPDRKKARNARLVEQALETLRALERVPGEPPAAQDALADWFSEGMAVRFAEVGLNTLGELSAAVARGQRWWRHMEAIGRTKAGRIAAYVEALLPVPASLVAWQPRPAAAPRSSTAVSAAASTVIEVLPPVQALVEQGGVVSMLSDAALILAWVKARARSEATAQSYQRELNRYAGWLSQRRGWPQGRALTRAGSEDCADYVAFLHDIPDVYIGVRARADSAQWRPFGGKLTAASQKQALVIINAFYVWIHRKGYIPHNPWDDINRKVAADQATLDAAEQSRAFSPRAWEAIVKYVDAPGDAARERTRFVFRFIASVGLRSAEFLSATLEQLRCDDEGQWAIGVIGKGGKARWPVIPPQALAALSAYLGARHLPPLDECAGDERYAKLPLLAALVYDKANQQFRHTQRRVTYRSFYDATKRTIQAALRESLLPQREKDRALAASPHWLRHTCGKRAADAGVDERLIMEQFGHSDPATVRRYTRVQRLQLAQGWGRVFG